jgi:probable rRNA maturation factor
MEWAPMAVEPDSMTGGAAKPLDVVTPLEVEVILEEAGWAECLDDPEGLCRRVLDHAARQTPEMEEGMAQLSVLLTDDARVRKLNAEFRGQDKPTNVLSFPAGEDEFVPPAGPVYLGDIAIALETVQGEAGAVGKPIGHHLAHLAVHGFLHLLGYDHLEDGEAQEMESLERQILAGLDIPDPY